MRQNNESPKNAETKDPRSRRVLVVEDDDGLNNLAQKALREAGYDAEGVLNAVEAIERVVANPDVALLLDVKLSDMTGSELIRALVERDCRVDFIVMTGQGDERTAVEMMKLGASDYLVKGFDLIDRLPGAFRRLFRELDTERRIRAAQEAVRESEKKYRELFELAQEGIWVIDKDNVTTIVNPSLAKMLGYAPNEMQGKHLFSFMDEQGVEISTKYLERRRRGINEQHDFEFIRKDGVRIFTTIETAPVWDEAGNYNGAIAGVVDITGRKRAEDELRESEERYRTLVESTCDGVAISNGEGELIFANSSYVSMFGYSSQDELIGTLAVDRYANPEDRAEIFKRLSKDGYAEGVELDMLKKDGARLSVLCSAVLRQDKSGKIIQAEATVTDITERKQAEEALRRYEHIVSSSTDLWALLNKEYIYLAASRSYLQAFNRTSDELIGRTVSDVFGEEFFKTVIKPHADRCLTGETTKYQTWFNLPAFGDRFMDIAYSPYIDVENEIQGFVVNARDITERRQVEVALSKSEKKFRNYVETSQDLIWECDDKGRFTYLNPAWEQVTGYKLSEMLGKPFTDFTIQEEIEKNAAEFARHLEGGYVKGYPSTYISKKGSEVYLIFNAIPLYDSDMNIIGTQGSAYDITESRLGNEALLESRERFRSLIESTADGIITADHYGNITLWNDGAQKMFGYRADEIMGKPITEIMPESYRTSHDEGMHRLVKTGETKHMGETLELEGLRKDGTVFPLELSLSTWHSQEIRFFAAIARDISERKEVEKTLRESDERLRMALRNTAITVFSQDKDLRYTWAYNMSPDFDADAILGKTDADLVTPEDAKTPMTVKRQVLQTGQGTRVEASYFRDGEKRFYDLLVEPLVNSLGEIVGVNCLSIDITERKRAEEEKVKLEEHVRRSQRLETIGTLAGGIAHDFNNILTPIMGYADMALSDPSLSNLLREDLEHILNGANRARDLVEQILLFSRKTEKERLPLRLHLIVKEAQKLLRPSIPTTIEIRQRIDASCDKVLADATQMHEVVVNLCTNAWQAMEEKGGTLTIELKQVEVDAATAKVHPQLNEQEYVRLSVSDTGTGMDDTTRERIFEPFFTTKAVDKGTGMGLAVVHGIVGSHHGDIHVASEPGKGSTFHVYLPTVSAARAEASKKELGAIQGGHESILVVDDELVVAKVVKRMLERLGYEVEVCKSSMEALKTFRQQPDKYDLMISDLTMPDMTGLVLAEELQKIRPEFPTIIMTGYGESLPEDILELYGIQEVIGKPIIIRELAGGIRKVLDNKGFFVRAY